MIKSRIIFRITVILFLSFPISIFGTENVDSLKQTAFSMSDADSAKITAIRGIYRYYLNRNADSCLHYAFLMKRLAELQKNPIELAMAEGSIAHGYTQKSDFKSAFQKFQLAMELIRKQNYPKGEGVILNNMGNAYYAIGDYTRALECYLSNLRIKEKIKDRNGMAQVCGNIGMIYNNFNDEEKAMEYYMLSYTISKESNNRVSMASALNNIGTLYFDKKEYKKSLEYYIQGLKIREELKQDLYLANSYTNIGGAYGELGDYKLAQQYHEKALQYYIKGGNKRGVALSEINFGVNYTEGGNPKAGIPHIEKGLHLAEELGVLKLIMEGHKALSKAYQKLGNLEKTVFHLERSAEYEDSISNAQKQMEIGRKEVQFALQKQMEVDSVKNAEEKKVIQAKMEQQKAENRVQVTVTWFFGIALLLSALAGFFAFKGYREKKASNIQISKQKQVIEEKQKEVMASITYAKRIQSAILPTDKYIHRSLEKLKK